MSAAVSEHKERNKAKHTVYVFLAVDELGAHPYIDKVLNSIKKAHSELFKGGDQLIPIFSALNPRTFKCEYQLKETFSSKRPPLTWLNLSTMPIEERQKLAKKQKGGLQVAAFKAYDFAEGVYRRIEEINIRLSKIKNIEEKSTGKLFLEAISLRFLYNSCREFWKCFAVVLLQLQTALGEQITSNTTTCQLMIEGILFPEEPLSSEEFIKKGWEEKSIPSCLVRTLQLYTYSLHVLNFQVEKKIDSPTEKDVCVAKLLKQMVEASAHIDDNKKFEECMDYFLILQLTLRAFLIDPSKMEVSVYPLIPTLSSLSTVRSVPFSKLFHDCIRIGRGCEKGVLQYKVRLCDEHGIPFRFDVDLDKAIPLITNIHQFGAPQMRYKRFFGERLKIEGEFKMNVCFASSHPEEPAIDAFLALFVTLPSGVKTVLYLMLQYKSREIETKAIEKFTKGDIEKWLENAVKQQKAISEAIKGKKCPITSTIFPGLNNF